VFLAVLAALILWGLALMAVDPRAITAATALLSLLMVSWVPSLLFLSEGPRAFRAVATAIVAIVTGIGVLVSRQSTRLMARR
jgi:hypothetical protein